MKKQRVLPRHKFYFKFFKFVGFFASKLYHVKYKKFKIKKNEKYLIISNHQTGIDPVFLTMSFNKPIYFMATDTLFNDSFVSKFVQHCFGPIKKRKAISDMACIRECVKISKEEGNIAIFVEGNRSWADFQIYIDPSICKLIKLLKMPVLFYNFEGGYGIDPRWRNKIRKGKCLGSVKSVLSYEDAVNMTEEELYNHVCKEIKVIDSLSNQEFISKKSAEYLERELFICPVCGAISALESHEDKIKCNVCNLEVTYTSKLTLESSHPKFNYKYLVDWYNYQLDYIVNNNFDDCDYIFTDDDCRIFDKTTHKRKLLHQGILKLTRESLSIGDVIIKVDDIVSSTIVGGNKLIVNTDNASYMIKGTPRFNGLKYVLLINKISEKVKDKYYSLEQKTM